MKFIILQLLLSFLLVGATEVDVPDLKKGAGTALLNFFKGLFNFDVNPTAPQGGYDLIIIGAGPAGESLAIAAKRIKKGCLNVAVIEKVETFGGPSGLVSKAVREVAQSIYQSISALNPDLAIMTRVEKLELFQAIWQRDFNKLKDDAVNFQAVETMMKFKQHGVEVYVGEATIKTPVSAGLVVKVKSSSNNAVAEQDLISTNLCIATGSTPNRPVKLKNVDIPWGHNRMLDSIKIGNLDQLPDSLGIIGGGVIAAEYATIYAKVGVKVTIFCPSEKLLTFLQPASLSALKARLTADGVDMVYDDIANIQATNDTVKVTLANTTTIKVDKLLYVQGTDGNSKDLGLTKGDHGIDMGKLKYKKFFVDKTTRKITNDNVPIALNIYAIGDVSYTSNLASHAQQDGRLLAKSLYAPNAQSNSDKPIFVDDMAPETYWTIPEAASVGYKLADAKKRINFTIWHDVRLHEGFGYFYASARGRLTGDMDGFVKVLAYNNPYTGEHPIIGVEIFGDGANELIQLASILLQTGATLEQVAATPFAAVTLSGLFQTASDDCLDKFADSAKFADATCPASAPSSAQ